MAVNYKMITLYLFLVLQRIFSGFKNAFGYSNHKNKMSFVGVFATLTTLTSLAYILFFDFNWFLLTCVTGTAAGAYSVFNGFKKDNGLLIHFNEDIVVLTFPISLLVCHLLNFNWKHEDWIYFWILFAGGINGNYLFNMPINYVASGSVFEKIDITDDATGKTYGLNLPNFLGGKSYRIPRIANGCVKIAFNLIVFFITIYLLF